MQDNSETPRPTPDSEDREEILIVPPGLAYAVSEFEAHYKSAAKEPIMIVGETGVGKSLFLRMAKRLYLEERQGDKNPPSPYEEANCAHFGGPQSDPNLARSEIFGVDRTFVSLVSRYQVRDKKEDKKTRERGATGHLLGLIEKARGGLLILEEIGELPLEVQAMLLTFIETGRYRRLGGKEELRADLQIVGATNKEEKLRPDFRYRFFPFYVPPIHERRQDILYYLHHKFRDIMGSITPFEALCLLVYNWPGNVREIYRVGRLFLRNRELMKGVKFDSESAKARFESYRLSKLGRRYTALGEHSFGDLRSDLEYAGVDISYLDKILMNFGLGLDENVYTPAFEELKVQNGFKLVSIPFINSRFGFEEFHVDCLDRAYTGLHVFCELFFQSGRANKNLSCLNDKDYKGRDNFQLSNALDIDYVEFPQQKEKKYRSLVSTIFECLSGVSLPVDHPFPDSLIDVEDLIVDLLSSNPNNEFLESVPLYRRYRDRERVKVHAKAIDIGSMKFEELRRVYLQGVFQRARGNISEVSRRTGLPRTTVYDDLQEVGVIPMRKKKPRNRIEDEKEGKPNGSA